MTTTTPRAADPTRRVLYTVACAAPPTLHIRTLIDQAHAAGWDTCLILTPTAARWLATDLPDLQQRTRHPVRSDYKLPGQPDVLPPPDAILVAPASSNTINKWAAGISDTLALGLITEAIGKRIPTVALPYLIAAQAAHPAFPRSISTLLDAGIRMLLGENGYQPHGPGQSRPETFPWRAALSALAD